MLRWGIARQRMRSRLTYSPRLRLSFSPLLRSSIRLQFPQVIADMSRTWRNSTGDYNWYDFAYTLRAAAALAQDMGLSSEQAILERMLTRGQLCSGASAVLP